MGRRLWHKSAVRVLACSPKSNLMLAGCADGSIYVWNLDKTGEPVRVIQDQHHGAISAESEGPGKGARFIVTLPLAERFRASEVQSLAKIGP